MTIIQMIRDLSEAMKKVTDKEAKKKIDDVIFELKIMPNPVLKSFGPQAMSATKIESLSIHLEQRLRTRYPELPNAFWMDLKKELAVLLQIEKL